MNIHEDLIEGFYQQGFYIMDDFLDQDHYLSLCKTIRCLHEEGLFQPAKIGSKQKKLLNPSIRNDRIYWLDKQKSVDASAAYFVALDQLTKALNQAFYLGLIDYEAHFAAYEPNSFYKKHVDQFVKTEDRRVSCVYYLNPHWQTEWGGELNLYSKQDELLSSVMPIGNRFICFNSDMPHEVCTAYQMRYSIAAWLKIRPWTS